jgi:hypothetical protein
MTPARMVAGAIALLGSLLFTSVFDRIGTTDVDRIRAARAVLARSCDAGATAEAMEQATATLEDYLQRAPDRPIPLSGGGGIWSVRAIVREVERFLARPVVAGRTLGGETPNPDAPCRRFGPAIGARLAHLLDASATSNGDALTNRAQ